MIYIPAYVNKLPVISETIMRVSNILILYYIEYNFCSELIYNDALVEDRRPCQNFAS